jgi:hypothetical protein
VIWQRSPSLPQLKETDLIMRKEKYHGRQL